MSNLLEDSRWSIDKKQRRAFVVVKTPRQSLKGIRGDLQKELHSIGIHGLEFWFEEGIGSEYKAFAIGSKFGFLFVKVIVEMIQREAAIK